MKIAEIFFRVYALYTMLLEHEALKVNEDYGFVKKEFQKMVMDNLSAINELERLHKEVVNFPNKQALDNVIFAEAVINNLMQDVAKYKLYNVELSINSILTSMKTKNRCLTLKMLL